VSPDAETARVASARGRKASPELAALAGAWRRSLLIDIDASTDTTSEVNWLQGASRFVDLRQPAGRPDFSRTHSASELNDEQRRWIADQAGFAGVLVPGGEFFEWRRRFDLQPPHSSPDAGTLRFEGDLLIEKGWYEGYTEHWVRQTPTLGPVWAVELAGPGRSRAMIVRVGRRFGWACELDEPGTGTGIEIALGSVAEGRAAARPVPANRVRSVRAATPHPVWTIEQSSRPYREGADLGLRFGSPVTSRDIDRHGRPVELSWMMMNTEEEAPA
jgi:hypothetical protein